ncbi:MAG: ABC transporter substrate-binding protein [Castellaniella sp.]|uniref:ABC transporter substrate-binding protein n=1 Tax=Castellaniella sp. TaxID=1955812 RepID=UPI002A367C31|nr:ABC transporter substrate-binding protein [Castellaniella sp.]MDY0309732.1 ABC transporter substrate-binding protein [Castellaniella sp.]
MGVLPAAWVAGLMLALSVGAVQATECRRVVKDAAGLSVCVPERIERIAITCYGGAIQEIAVFKGGDRVIAQPGVESFPQFARMFPELGALPDVGSFSNVNLESLLTEQPDMVFASVFSAQTNDRIKALGIPVFTLGTGRQDIQTILDEFGQVGTLLGKEDLARDLVSYWHERLTLIRSRTAGFETPKRVLYLGGSGGTENRRGWGDAFITAAGGINVARDTETQGVVAAEQVRLWNPDVIIASMNDKSRVSAAAIRTQAAYRQVQAVVAGQVHAAPIGGFWWDRPSPEAILGILWLSKILYPEVLEDVDLAAETRLFFSRFYGYALPDAEYQRFFEPAAQ